MQSKTNRDEAIEQTLRATFRADAPASDDCIDPETIAAWSDRTPPAATAMRVESHLSQCPRCQAMLAVMARSIPPTAAPPSLWQRWHLRWVVPIAAAASALALWVAIPADRRAPAPQPAALHDSKQEIPASTPEPRNAPSEATDQLKPNLEKRSAAGLRQQRQKTEASRTDTSDAAAPAAAAADRNPGSANSLAETTAAKTAAPASPPPAAAAPARERGEFAAQRQAQTVVEAAAPDAASRWRILDRTRIERSSDSGTTWEAVAFPERTNLTAIRALSTLAAIVTTADGRQFRTDDGGGSWTLIRDE